MPSAETRYIARLELPEDIVRDRDCTIQCPVYLSGALAAPSSGTVSLYDDSNTPVISGAAVTVSGSVATYVVPTSTMAGYSYGVGWRIEWALVMPDGVTHTFQQRASVVRVALYPVVTEADLYRVAPALEPGATAITAESDYTDQITEAWVQLVEGLVARGNRPNLLLQPSDLRTVHLYWTLFLVYEGLASRLNEAYADRADSFRRQRDDAWARLTFKYATEADDGTPAEGRRNRSPTTMLQSRGGGRWRRWR